MSVRIATKKDLNLIAELFNAYRIFYKKESDIEGAKVFLNDRLTLEDSAIYVYEDPDGELLGFVQLYPLFSSTRMKKLWLLNDLFVNATHRGKGVSIQLINKAKELVEKSNACGMFLETGKNNLIGNNLYPKVGFELNTYANYYEWTPPSK